MLLARFYVRSKFWAIRFPRRSFATRTGRRSPMRSTRKACARSGSRARRTSSPSSCFSSGADDGQELTNLVIANDDAHVVYVRGGDHDANWPLPLQPGPASMPTQPDMQVWSVSTTALVARRSCSAPATRRRSRPTARASRSRTAAP